MTEVNMPVEQRMLSIAISLFIISIIFELVRRRKLREEYSWLWVLTGVIVFLLAFFEQFVFFISNLFKAKAPISIVYFLSFIFLFLLNLHFSVSISNLKTRIKELVQKLALLEEELIQARNKNED